MNIYIYIYLIAIGCFYGCRKRVIRVGETVIDWCNAAHDLT